MIGDRAPAVGMAHAMHDRAVAAGRLAEAAPMFARRQRAELAVHQRHQLCRQVVRIAAERARIDVLVAPEPRKAIRKDDDRRPHPALVQQAGRLLGDIFLERLPVQVRRPASGEAHQIEQHGEAAPAAAPLRLVVVRRQPHVEAAHMGIALRVALQHARDVLQRHDPSRAVRRFAWASAARTFRLLQLAQHGFPIGEAHAVDPRQVDVGELLPGHVALHGPARAGEAQFVAVAAPARAIDGYARFVLGPAALDAERFAGLLIGQHALVGDLETQARFARADYLDNLSGEQPQARNAVAVDDPHFHLGAADARAPGRLHRAFGRQLQAVGRIAVDGASHVLAGRRRGTAAAGTAHRAAAPAAKPAQCLIIGGLSRGARIPVRRVEDEPGGKRDPQDLVQLVRCASCRRHSALRVDALHIAHAGKDSLPERPGMQQQPAQRARVRRRIVSDDGPEQVAAVDVLERVIGAVVGHHLAAAVAQLRLRQAESPMRRAAHVLAAEDLISGGSQFEHRLDVAGRLDVAEQPQRRALGRSRVREDRRRPRHRRGRGRSRCGRRSRSGRPRRRRLGGRRGAGGHRQDAGRSQRTAPPHLLENQAAPIVVESGPAGNFIHGSEAPDAADAIVAHATNRNAWRRHCHASMLAQRPDTPGAVRCRGVPAKRFRHVTSTAGPASR